MILESRRANTCSIDDNLNPTSTVPLSSGITFSSIVFLGHRKGRSKILCLRAQAAVMKEIMKEIDCKMRELLKIKYQISIFSQWHRIRIHVSALSLADRHVYQGGLCVQLVCESGAVLKNVKSIAIVPALTISPTHTQYRDLCRSPMLMALRVAQITIDILVRLLTITASYTLIKTTKRRAATEKVAQDSANFFLRPSQCHHRLGCGPLAAA
ncbi:hypothetical protein OG21DRAFT_1523192 [Imleria badia]|nr:hypothetical protein OG21DRAFT_1523192 [Imleria badia]